MKLSSITANAVRAISLKNFLLKFNRNEGTPCSLLLLAFQILNCILKKVFRIFRVK